MGDIAKALIVMGGILLLVGLALLALGKIPGFGRLPGDILIKKENFTFYFPLATCFLISALLTLLFYLVNRR